MRVSAAARGIGAVLRVDGAGTAECNGFYKRLYDCTSAPSL